MDRVKHGHIVLGYIKLPDPWGPDLTGSFPQDDLCPYDPRLRCFSTGEGEENNHHHMLKAS